MVEIPLRCSCGSFTASAGLVEEGRRARLVCYCDDCQAYAEFLGRSDDMLDAHGGTQVCQTTPRRYRVASGAEHIACVSLKEKGLKRWYVSCCNTPIANTTRAAKVAFVGVPRVAVADSEQVLTEKAGAVSAKVNGRFARGGCPSDAHPKVPLGMMVSWMKLALSLQIRGEAKPHPFFDAAGTPIVEAQVLTVEERAALNTPRA